MHVQKMCDWLVEFPQKWIKFNFNSIVVLFYGDVVHDTSSIHELSGQHLTINL